MARLLFVERVISRAPNSPDVTTLAVVMPSNRPLLKAVKSGKIGKLERELLHASSSADLNEAVTEAAKLRHADMVLALLRSGASVHGEHTDAQPAGTTKLLAKNEKDKALFKKVGGLDAETRR